MSADDKKTAVYRRCQQSLKSLKKRGFALKTLITDLKFYLDRTFFIMQNVESPADAFTAFCDSLEVVETTGS